MPPSTVAFLKIGDNRRIKEIFVENITVDILMITMDVLEILEKKSLFKKVVFRNGYLLLGDILSVKTSRYKLLII